MIDNSDFETNGFFHFYACPLCAEVIKCKTADNLDVLARIHEFDHRQAKRIQAIANGDMAVPAPLPLAKIEIKNLTTADEQFLRSCGIKT